MQNSKQQEYSKNPPRQDGRKTGKGKLKDEPCHDDEQNGKKELSSAHMSNTDQQETKRASSDVVSENNVALKSPDLSFPWRLFIMLQNSVTEGFSDTISWEMHGKMFRIYNPKAFEEKILPRYFKMTKYNSFTRQLYAYGFTWIREGPGKGGYYHKQFLREEPHNCSIMRRKTSRRLQQNEQEETFSEFHAIKKEKEHTEGTTSTGILSHLQAVEKRRGNDEVFNHPKFIDYRKESTTTESLMKKETSTGIFGVGTTDSVIFEKSQNSNFTRTNNHNVATTESNVSLPDYFVAAAEVPEDNSKNAGTKSLLDYAVLVGTKRGHNSSVGQKQDTNEDGNQFGLRENQSRIMYGVGGQRLADQGKNIHSALSSPFLGSGMRHFGGKGGAINITNKSNTYSAAVGIRANLPEENQRRNSSSTCDSHPLYPHCDTTTGTTAIFFPDSRNQGEDNENHFSPQEGTIYGNIGTDPIYNVDENQTLFCGDQQDFLSQQRLSTHTHDDETSINQTRLDVDSSPLQDMDLFDSPLDDLLEPRPIGDIVKRDS